MRLLRIDREIEWRDWKDSRATLITNKRLSRIARAAAETNRAPQPLMHVIQWDNKEKRSRAGRQPPVARLFLTQNSHLGIWNDQTPKLKESQTWKGY